MLVFSWCLNSLWHFLFLWSSFLLLLSLLLLLLLLLLFQYYYYCYSYYYYCYNYYYSTVLGISMANFEPIIPPSKKICGNVAQKKICSKVICNYLPLDLLKNIFYKVLMFWSKFSVKSCHINSFYSGIPKKALCLQVLDLY